ncbi:uncharacterized [Tachysurus ichikawai]
MLAEARRPLYSCKLHQKASWRKVLGEAGVFCGTGLAGVWLELGLVNMEVLEIEAVNDFLSGVLDLTLVCSSYERELGRACMH